MIFLAKNIRETEHLCYTTFSVFLQNMLWQYTWGSASYPNNAFAFNSIKEPCGCTMWRWHLAESLELELQKVGLWVRGQAALWWVGWCSSTHDHHCNQRSESIAINMTAWWMDSSAYTTDAEFGFRRLYLSQIESKNYWIIFQLKCFTTEFKVYYASQHCKKLLGFKTKMLFFYKLTWATLKHVRISSMLTLEWYIPRLWFSWTVPAEHCRKTGIVRKPWWRERPLKPTYHWAFLGKDCLSTRKNMTNVW